jgi:hypothetical protein
MLGQPQCRSFFEEVRSAWKSALDHQEQPEHLRLFIERLDPDNYTFELRGNQIVAVDFLWPEAMQRENERSLREIGDEQTISRLPWRCRQFLDTGGALPPNQLRWLWDFLQRIDATPPELPGDPHGPLLRIEDVVCAGIAVFFSTSWDWLLDDPSRMAWCRRKLQATVDNPPAPRRFDSELSIGDERWDCFAVECGVILLTANTSDALARRLVGAGLVAFNYHTTALTMTRAAALRSQLGDAFSQMVAMAIQWAALRPRQVRADDSVLNAEREAFLAGKQKLLDAFADGSLPSDAIGLRKINAETQAARDAMNEKRFPGSSRRLHRRNFAGRSGSREVLYPDRLGLDPYVIKSAFAWVNLGSAKTADERSVWLGFVREILGLVLEALPIVAPGSRQKIDGLPSDFDSWVFEFVARTIPCMTAAEQPEELWQAIVSRGAPAHEWVERFFWHWFTSGVAASGSPAEFVHIWRAMISYALEHSGWDPDRTISFELDDMVVELLGFDTRWNTLVQKADNVQVVGGLEDILARALERWGGMPKVISWLVVLASQPGASQLLLPALRWSSSAVKNFSSYDWKYGLEENVIEFLHTCWQRESARIARDESLRAGFLAVLTILVSRGSHAAIALSNRVIGSISD